EVAALLHRFVDLPARGDVQDRDDEVLTHDDVRLLVGAQDSEVEGHAPSSPMPTCYSTGPVTCAHLRRATELTSSRVFPLSPARGARASRRCARPREARPRRGAARTPREGAAPA